MATSSSNFFFCSSHRFSKTRISSILFTRTFCSASILANSTRNTSLTSFLYPRITANASTHHKFNYYHHHNQYYYHHNNKKYSTMSAPSSFYDLKPADKTGAPYDFSQLKGKVVLIVNVASKCGFTPQYKELEEVYKKYSPEGLVILGFPCNQFGHQEPGTDEEITQFCQLNYGVTFPVLKKVDVNGSNADPVYEFLKSKKSGLLGFKGIKWNFEKFLIDKNGQVIERYSSITKPSSIASEIEKLLKA
ncbi:uncharacterized protein SAPINGB_P005029 [Magnusiomyces paraingens]|uniref:Glutathione peroxidase n=1 Tax=Magnusiomyces paraingens TaxID=2606893 RepID=A0A5E8C0I1_9ASCO|nr:uncharacterized protein SAPINGB_P005029 [Saprochaete ingens]VVT56385.1 unnamed protein product [Saprochaete ingens]